MELFPIWPIFVAYHSKNNLASMRYDVFISYSSKDQKVAEGVCAYLEQHGIRCFIAYRDIPKGKDWAEVIPLALRESRMMLAVFSENFNLSKQVDREISIAAKRQIPILTFRITDDEFRGTKEYYLTPLNWIDAFPEPEKCFGELCRNVQALLAAEKERTIHNSAPREQAHENVQEPLQSEKEETKSPEVFDLDTFVDLEEAEAFAYCRQLAEKGDKVAQLWLGRLYYDGSGIMKNYAETIRWWTKAAEQGYEYAQRNLADCYLEGKGTLINYAKAVYWYRKAAEQGNHDSLYKLGYCYYHGYGVEQDYAEAVQYWTQAAEQGHVLAQNSLGKCYFKGQGVRLNETEAVRWFREAAKKNLSDAQFNLGWCYNWGRGIGEDRAEAVRWYRKAAEQGHAEAQYRLANCYDWGEGVRQDRAEAVKWYRKAAAQGHAGALKNVGG